MDQSPLRREGWTLDHLFLLKQIHGDAVVRIRSEEDFENRKHGKGDAVISTLPGRPISIKTADCLPILVAHSRGVVAAVHAGWRGSAKKILGKTLRILQTEFHLKPDELHLAIGPAICQAHYEVGEEVAQEFPAQQYPGALRPAGKKFLLDLKRVNVLQALQAGVLEKHLTVHPQCTYEDLQWYSHRRSLKEGWERGGRNYAWVVFKN